MAAESCFSLILPKNCRSPGMGASLNWCSRGATGLSRPRVSQSQCTFTNYGARIIIYLWNRCALRIHEGPVSTWVTLLRSSS